MENDTLDQLLAKVEELTQEKWEHLQKYDELRKVIHDIEKIIYKKCNHKWELDYSAVGIYDGPDKVCKTCKLYCDPYTYR